MTCGPIAAAITYCIMLLDVKFGKGKQNKATVDIIVYFERNYVTIWRCPRWAFYMYSVALRSSSLKKELENGFI